MFNSGLCVARTETLLAMSRARVSDHYRGRRRAARHAHNTHTEK